MDDRIVPFPAPATKPRDGEQEISRAWIECLSEAIAMRTEQGFDYRLPTAPEIRNTAKRIGPLAGEFGLESPIVFRAVAALVTMVHPFVLLCLLAGIPTAADPRLRWAKVARARGRQRKRGGRGGRS
jgi:hypothetical protein